MAQKNPKCIQNCHCHADGHSPAACEQFVHNCQHCHPENFITIRSPLRAGKTVENLMAFYVSCCKRLKALFSSPAGTIYSPAALESHIAELREEWKQEQLKNFVSLRLAVMFDGKELTHRVSDGYHTFEELYDHRITLFIALCRFVMGEDEMARSYGGVHRENRVWRSKQHQDGSMFDGWFIMGIGAEARKQITYHLPIARWEETGFAETLERAPEWDGHTPADVLERIKKL